MDVLINSVLGNIFLVNLGNAGVATAVVAIGGVDSTVRVVSRGVELIFTKVTPSLWSSTIIIVLLIDSWPF
jgi:hypothetical protein